MGLVLHTLGRMVFPRWLWGPILRGLGRLFRRVTYRLVQLLLVATAAVLGYSLWREATYTWPLRAVVRRVAQAAGVQAEDREQLIAALRAQGFRTVASGTTCAEVRRLFAAAGATQDTGPSREAFYFNFAGEHEFGFYPDYDTADRLVALTWQHDFLWALPPEPLALRPSP